MRALDLLEPDYHFWHDINRYSRLRMIWYSTGNPKALQEMLTCIAYSPDKPKDGYWQKADNWLDVQTFGIILPI